MDLLSIVLTAVVVAILAVLLRTQRPEQALLLVLAAGSVMLIVLLSKAESIFESVRNFLSQSGLPEDYVTILFKGLGICLITQLASDTCKDAGEMAMSAKAELAGRIAVLIVGLPLFQKMVTVALSLIGGSI